MIGPVVGTANRLSPEPVRGQGAYARRDAFPFGAVLYEMITGRGRCLVPFELTSVLTSMIEEASGNSVRFVGLDVSAVVPAWGKGLTLLGRGAGVVVLEASGAGLASRRTGKAATQARIAASEVVSLETSGSFGYDCGLRSDNCEIPV